MRFSKTYLYFLIIIGFLITNELYAQKPIRTIRRTPFNLAKHDNKPLHFGFTLGLNTMDFGIRYSDKLLMADSIDIMENQRQVGFNISIVSNLRLGEYWDLRFLPGLAFGQRDLEYSVFNKDNGNFDTHVMKIESTFIILPLVFKYKSVRPGNYRAYLIGGINPVYDLASQKEVKAEEKPKIRLKPIDLYYEIGVGFDFYLTYFKLSTEIKYSIGLFDIVQKDNTQYTGIIDKMNSRMLTLSFHFE